MPAAVGGINHSSNEECGIRDVWAHNLEEEFRTIRQVTVYFAQFYLHQKSIADCSKIPLCCHGYGISGSGGTADRRI
jgi:hypothetical protein